MKFVLYIDYKITNNQNRYEYKTLKAKTLEEAIIEVETQWNDAIYLAQILKKSGKIEKVTSKIKREPYQAILAKRSNGWYPNENNESYHSAYRVFAKDWEYFE